MEPGTRLDINSLDTQGRFFVPTPVAGADAYNAFIQPIIDRYGYVQNGVSVGGGIVGYGLQFDNDDFYRDEAQIGYNLTLGTSVIHELHVGYQWLKESEDLLRRSNGWGEISVPGGRLAPVQGQRAYYTARIQQQLAGQDAFLHSESQTHNFEVNDTIKWANWTFNVGALVSKDTLYGQGLRDDSSTVSGYVAAPANKYTMYEIPFSKMIQPRVGATWAYNGKDTVYASYARYNPSASSLPRAASWDRNFIGTFVDVHFDQNGVAFAAVPVGSSSGKLFVPDMTPRRTEEFLVGTARQLAPRWTARVYGRYRKGAHFWEDTNNNARVVYEPPPGIPQELYIPNLDDAAGPDRQRIELRHRRAGRRLHQVLRGHRGVGVAGRQDLRPRLLHLEPLLRQLRPGQLHGGQRRERLHRLVLHRPTARGASSGTSGTETSAATGPTC